jgi:phosphoglycolate phosphatase-like HAD superfamily hydrolase
MINNQQILLLEDEHIKSLPKPEVIALDLDLTLHNVIKHYDESIVQTVIHFGYGEVSHEQLDAAGQNFSTTRAMLANFLPENLLDDALQYYLNHFISREMPISACLPGSKELLYLLRKRLKLPVVAVTNAEEFIAKKILLDLGALHWFDYVIGVKEGNIPKPGTQMLIMALDIIKAKPGPHVWLIGDMASDTKCAKNAGCTAIRFYHKIKPEDVNADLFINNHFALYNIIANKVK